MEPQEPSVLDFVKSRLLFWKGKPIPFPAPVDQTPPPLSEAGSVNMPALLGDALPAGAAEPVESPGELPVLEVIAAQPAPPSEIPIPEPQPEPDVYTPPLQPTGSGLPWRSLLALGLALAAQFTFEPRPDRTPWAGIVLYLLAAVWLVIAFWRGEWRSAENSADMAENSADTADADGGPTAPTRKSGPFQVSIMRLVLLVSALLLAGLAFWSFGDHLFTWQNLYLWGGAVLLMAAAFWTLPPGWSRGLRRITAFFSEADPQWRVTVSRWSLLIVAALALAAFFRFYRLADVPPQMVSDHAEKLLDVYDVMNGQPWIYFPRNTGREAFQMYWTALMIGLFGQGYSFLSLKLGTAIGGMLTLPFIYLIGKEMGSRRAGLWAMALAGIAYWPNLIARIALRFTLYPWFYAPALYFLLRGLRRRSLNDFILSGVFVGIGLHGYSPFRFVPVAVVLAVGLYLLHRQSRGWRQQAVLALAGLALTAAMVFVPLARYAVDNPEMFNYRAMTRLGSVERALPGDPLVIFLQNLWNAVTMFAWDNGEVWVISLTHRPVLDLVTGALFHLGALYVFLRYLRQRHWWDLYTLLSIPLLMMPSILSLAFPGENPSLNRTAGAIIPVFLLAGIAVDGLIQAFKNRLPAGGARWGWALALILMAVSVGRNFEMVFREYQSVYEASSWNTNEMGEVVRDFAASVGSIETAYLVGYPHWADSRLVAVSAGYPTRDPAIFPDRFAETTADPRAKLFLLNVNDAEGLAGLQLLYPQGVLQTYVSRYPTKDFLLFFVPPRP